MCSCRPSAPCTPCSIGMAWSTVGGDDAVTRPQGTTLSSPCAPNDLWCADYKGEFMLADRRYCYPLTITRLRQPLPDQLRGAGDHPGEVRLYRVRARLQGLRPAQGHPHRQRRALRQRLGALRPEQALGLVAAARDPHRAHQARPSAAERPARAHAPDAEEGSHQAGSEELPSAAGEVRSTSSSATTASGRIKRSTCSTRPSSTSLHRAPIGA